MVITVHLHIGWTGPLMYRHSFTNIIKTIRAKCCQIKVINVLNVTKIFFFATTLNSAIAASSRNCSRTYSILLCHFMTQNQKLRCSPQTFRSSFYGIQGVPKKFELLTYPSSKDPGGKFWFQLQISKIWAPIELKFFWGHPGYHKSLT